MGFIRFLNYVYVAQLTIRIIIHIFPRMSRSGFLFSGAW